MVDLVDSSIESMLRQMTPETLAPLINLVTGNYYGRSGDKVLASAKAMLCRDGWKMPLALWDNIPGDIVREIVGGDGFYIDGEWDRWVLAKRILDRRLKRAALEAGLTDPRSKNKVSRAPDAANLMAVRFDNVYRKNSMVHGGAIPDNVHGWIALYTHPDVEPILVLLDEGIHYVHLPFEQLQYMRRARDVLGLPVLPERIISNALWMQMELRQKVVNARDNQLELGLSQLAEDWQDKGNSVWGNTMASTDSTALGKGKGKANDASHGASGAQEDDIASDSWDGNGKPRKFWIPSTDCNIVMGGNADPIVAASPAGAVQNHTSRLSATLQPEDVQWASDFAALTSDTRASVPLARPGSAGAASVGSEMPPVAYSHFPPFRFSTEFPNPRVLKERKRVYSKRVFYLGSFWNVYVQRVQRGKNPQLGVYLHRAKDQDTAEAAAGPVPRTPIRVGDQIGQLEREMNVRADDRNAERRRTLVRRRSDGGSVEGDGGDSSGSVEVDGRLAVGEQGASATARGMIGRKTSQTADEAGDCVSGLGRGGSANPDLAGDEEEDDDDDADNVADDAEVARLTRASHVPTMPPYVDGRPTIRTYFKIYSPSKGGRMLSVYESAPDKFNFSQSWGWKSSTLMLDDGLMPDEGAEDVDMPMGEVKKDGKLRFMIVIGNV